MRTFVMRKKEKRRRKMKMKVLAIVAMALVATTIVNPNAKAGSNDEQIVVTIKGNVQTVDFNGELQSSIGYTTEISSPLYSADNFLSFAIDSVSATNAGTYSMGISSSDFCNINPNFKNVVFVVYDGQLSIGDENAPKIQLASEK